MNPQSTCDHKIALHVDKFHGKGEMWIYMNVDAKEFWPKGFCPLCGVCFKVEDDE